MGIVLDLSVFLFVAAMFYVAIGSAMHYNTKRPKPPQPPGWSKFSKNRPKLKLSPAKEIDQISGVRIVQSLRKPTTGEDARTKERKSE